MDRAGCGLERNSYCIPGWIRKEGVPLSLYVLYVQERTGHTRGASATA